MFDPAGRMVAEAADIPVHLGAMPLSVAATLARFKVLADGDIVVLNDPYAGGSHLPGHHDGVAGVRPPAR